jgi:ketosteroid isomerase-like protein
MKLALKFIPTLLLSLLFLSLFAHAAADPDVLASSRETWMLALRAGDAAKASSVFTADAISMPQNFPTNVGRKSIENFYSDGFATLTLQSIEMHSADRKLDGPNTVREHGTYKASWAPKDGSPPYSLAGRYLFIGKRQPDGTWQVSWEIHTIESKLPSNQL